jgi:hypothetical protein
LAVIEVKEQGHYSKRFTLQHIAAIAFLKVSAFCVNEAQARASIASSLLCQFRIICFNDIVVIG